MLISNRKENQSLRTLSLCIKKTRTFEDMDKQVRVSVLLSSLWSSQTTVEGVVFRTVFSRSKRERGGNGPEIKKCL